MLFKELCQEAKEIAYLNLIEEKPYVVIQLFLDNYFESSSIQIECVSWKNNTDSVEFQYSVMVKDLELFMGFLGLNHPLLLLDFKKLLKEFVDSGTSSKQLFDFLQMWLQKKKNFKEMIEPFILSAQKNFQELKADKGYFEEFFDSTSVQFAINGTPVIEE